MRIEVLCHEREDRREVAETDGVRTGNGNGTIKTSRVRYALLDIRMKSTWLLSSGDLPSSGTRRCLEVSRYDDISGLPNYDQL